MRARAIGLAFIPVALWAQGPVDPLVSLNQTFRSWYAAEKVRREEHPGPVVMVKGDVLVFLTGGGRKEVRLIPAEYHRLKADSHIPLALEVRLGPRRGTPLAPEDLEALRAYRDRLPLALLELRNEVPDGPGKSRSLAIVSASEALLDEVLDQKQVSAAGLRRYLRAMSPLVLFQAKEAAALELGSLDAAMQAWRRELRPEEWCGFHVVVMGAHMAREQEIAMQYFLKLTGEKQEGGRVVFLEGQWDESKALDLLATHLVDGDVGRDFFGDTRRMHRDLLSDAAKEWLGTHPLRR